MTQVSVALSTETPLNGLDDDSVRSLGHDWSERQSERVVFYWPVNHDVRQAMCTVLSRLFVIEVGLLDLQAAKA